MGGTGTQVGQAATQTPPEGGSNGRVLEHLEDVDITQEQFDSAPEWLRESLTKANKEAGRYRTSLRDAEKVINEAGGADRVKELHWYTTSDEGIKELFNELADIPDLDKKVGVSSEQLKGLLAGAKKEATTEAAAQEAATGVALTKEQVDELVQTKVQEAVGQVTQTQEMETLREKVTAHLKTKGYEDDLSFGAITQLAAKRQAEVPADIQASGDKFAPYLWALDKGVEDYEAHLEKVTGTKPNREQYLQEKASDASTTPKANTGSTPASGEKWDPSSLSWDELTAQAREKGYFDR